jgi:hypothetical protein
MQPDDQIYTYTWLLAPREVCSACGAEGTSEAPNCDTCNRSFMWLYRPPQRSTTTKALIGAWLIGFFGALLALIGVLFQMLGVIEQSSPPYVLRALLIGCTIILNALRG